MKKNKKIRTFSVIKKLKAIIGVYGSWERNKRSDGGEEDGDVDELEYGRLF
jgi:hypothetical protein